MDNEKNEFDGVNSQNDVMGTGNSAVKPENAECAEPCDRQDKKMNGNENADESAACEKATDDNGINVADATGADNSITHDNTNAKDGADRENTDSADREGSDGVGVNGNGESDLKAEGIGANGNAENVFPPNPPKSGFPERPNAAEVLNSYLFGTSDTKRVKPPKKDSPALRRFMKTACLLLLTLAVSFSGAFACFYWVCNTALLGDSDFFRTLMLQGSGITVNHVEVDKISGSYEEDSIALAEKISQCSVDLQIFTEGGERAGSGSGVVLSADGLAITNYHVVYGYEKNTKAVLADGTVCAVTVIHLDKISDLAVIKIDSGKKLTPAVWGDSTKLKKGQSVAICGNPLGLGSSVSFGKIGYPDRDLGEVAGNFIQIDVSVNPGNSGGGVFDGAGNLIGIVNSKASGSNVDGIGYAIPSERAMDVVNQLLDDGVVDGRPAIGFTLVQVNQSTWDYFKNGDGTAPGELNGYLFEAKYGIYIIESKYNTEILKGDRIISCNGIAFDDRDNFSQWLLKYKAGDTVRITVERITLVTQNPDGSYNVTREQKTFECVLQKRDWPDEPYQK